MLNLNSKIISLLMHEHREIKKYGPVDKLSPEDLCKQLKHITRRDVYIEVLSLVDQFLDQIE